MLAPSWVLGAGHKKHQGRASEKKWLVPPNSSLSAQKENRSHQTLAKKLFVFAHKSGSERCLKRQADMSNVWRIEQAELSIWNGQGHVEGPGTVLS